MHTVTHPDMENPHVRVLGSVEIFTTDANRSEHVHGTTATLLAAVVAAADKGVSIEDLSRIYWPARRPAHWRSLIELYAKRLEQRIANTWTLEVDDIIRLKVAGLGWIDAWQTLGGLGVPANPHNESANHMLAPYPGIQHRGIIQQSAATLNKILVDKLNDPSVEPIQCDGSHTDDCHLLMATEHHRLITTTNSDLSTQMDALRNLVRSHTGNNPLMIAGGIAAGLPFGDIAVAFEAVRWELLGIEGRSAKAQVATGWRIIRDKMNETRGEMPRDLLIVDAHLLDRHSSALITQLITYRFEPALRVTVCGDAASRDDDWLHLIDAIASGEGVHLSICDACPPEILVGHGGDQTFPDVRVATG